MIGKERISSLLLTLLVCVRGGFAVSASAERVAEMEDQLHFAQEESKKLKEKNRKLKVCLLLTYKNVILADGDAKSSGGNQAGNCGEGRI